jgi:phosphatidylserine/phosphatidylglycerophosphate/cardiolipin synthase-like enzyme
VRLGSANLNRRSMGLDTECDLAFEGETDEACAAIAALRDNLVSEHLGVARGKWIAAVTSAGSHLSAIDWLNCGSRGFVPYAVDAEMHRSSVPLAIDMIDPSKPMRLPAWPNVTAAAGSPTAAPAGELPQRGRQSRR